MVKEARVPAGGRIPSKRGKEGAISPRGKGTRYLEAGKSKATWGGITGIQAGRPGQFRGIWAGLVRQLEARGQ